MRRCLPDARLTCALAVFAFTLGMPPARADESVHAGVALTAGLSGVGADVGLGINDYLGVRGTVSGLAINRTGNFGTSVGWDAQLKLFQAGVLLDAYPFAGDFRLTAGVVDDGNKLTLTGRPAGGTYTFNGTTYPASAVSNASASVDWSKPVAYIGLGWGRLAGSRGWHVTTDVGTLITGSPNTSLSATCNVPGACANFDANLAVERTKLQNDAHNVSFWPVLRVGIGYAF